MRRLFASLVAALIGAGGGLIVQASPAAAHVNGCPAGSNDTVMRDWPAACRDFIVDPGIGNLIDRSRLLAAASTYTSPRARFTHNFLWYSTEEHVTVSDPGTPWTSCQELPGPGNVCPDDKIEGGHSVLRAFHRDGREGHPYEPVTLSVFEFGGMWISKVCGNWHDIAQRPNPVPRITGIKFRDADRDGSRDGGEVTLAGWQIRVVRETSLVGQATGVVATPTTGGDGRYVFELDGHGPGRYRVEEVVQDGWKNYTAVAQTVDVPFGARDTTYTVDFGNAETTTDVRKADFSLVAPPTRLEINQPAPLTVRSTVINDGPAGPIDVDETLSVVSAAADCTIAGVPPRRRVTLDVGESLTFDDVLTVTCSRRSDHPFSFANRLDVVTPDVTDVRPGNNQARIDVTIPVFEQTTLGLGELHLVCDQYWTGDPFTCSASARASNLGDAPDAVLAAALTLDGDPSCTTIPSQRQEQQIVVGAHASRAVAAAWTVSCPDPALRSFRLLASLAVDEPHLEAAPVDSVLTWTPLDIKPNSDPNSLNIGRRGVVSVAVLSTATFDAVAQVDTTTLRWGPTGTEAVVVRCGDPEDANGDGLADLVCKFNLEDAHFEAGDELGIVTGLLVDGTPFMSADRVRIV